MQLNNVVVIVRSLIVCGSHPGEGGSEAGPGVGGGAEAVQLPVGLGCLLHWHHLFELIVQNGFSI